MTEFHIDPNFSVFQLVQRKRSKGISVSHLPVLQEISQEIENASLIDHANNILFCGFQQLSQFEPQITRYQKLAQECEHIFIFAVPDIEIEAIENITFVPLDPRDQLAKEWFIVSYGHDYFSALAAEEIIDGMVLEDEREYQGIWIFDLRMVEILYDWLCRKVGLDPEHIEQSQEIFRHELTMMEKTLSRVQEFIEHEKMLHHDTTVEEIKVLLEKTLYPALMKMQTVVTS